MALKEMTLGQVGRALVRYQPFVAAVAAVLLIVVLVPGRDDQPRGDRGVTAGNNAPAAQQGGTARPGTAAPTGPTQQQGGTTVTTAAGGATTSGGGGAVSSGGGSTSSGGGGTATGAGTSSGGTATAGDAGSVAAPTDDGSTQQDPGTAAPPPPPQGFGPNCDPATGRIKYPSTGAPPCVTPWDGQPGGATYQGVTDNEIVVAVFHGQADPAAQAILAAAGADDSREQVDATREAYFDIFQKHFETYGRTIKLVHVEASGEPEDDAAGKADAIKVATEIKAFVSLGSANNTYVDELAARGVLCICTVSLPIELYLNWAPYVWSPGLMASTQGYIHRAEYVGKILAHKKAVHAGDPIYTTQDRKFGILYYELADGSYGAGVDFFETELAKYNVQLADRVAYILDLARAQEDARTMIARMKDRGINSLIFSGDPLMPIFLTQEATKQNYNPEWIITGSALTDTSFFARTYDKTQWSNAFGVSYLSARGPQEEGDAYRIHVWHHGRPPEADDTYSVTYPGYAFLSTAIHLAGPTLDPTTFRDGVWSAPPTNGAYRDAKTSVGYSYGPAGKIWPWDDYLAADDATEIWWDNTASGKDEIGNDGVGLYRYVDGGKRFAPNAWPTRDPKAFIVEGSVTIYDTTPPEDRWPDYPHEPHE